MPSQKQLDETYLSMAKTWSQLSKAKRKQVGCLIVKDGAIISDGYNGTPKILTIPANTTLTQIYNIN